MTDFSIPFFSGLLRVLCFAGVGLRIKHCIAHLVILVIDFVAQFSCF